MAESSEIKGKKPDLLKSLITYFILTCLMIFFNFWLFGLVFSGWSPPTNKPLITVTGKLSGERLYNPCLTFRCPFSYSFSLQNNNKIFLNCEPSPPVNECFDKYISENSKIKNKNNAITIQYYQLGDGSPSDDFKLVMSASNDDGSIFDYKQRVKDINNTYVIANKTGHSTRKVKSSSAYGLPIILSIITIIVLFVAPFIGEIRKARSKIS